MSRLEKPIYVRPRHDQRQQNEMVLMGLQRYTKAYALRGPQFRRLTLHIPYEQHNIPAALMSPGTSTLFLENNRFSQTLGYPPNAHLINFESAA